MFIVRLVARPDARMVEVPLEIETELPREFDGSAVLASSGLPRKVKIKAQKDAFKLSTAYKTDQLVADVVKVALRGTALDVQKVQEAVKAFIRTVRERRQDGAMLTVTSNGRGKIDVLEQGANGRTGAPAPAAPNQQTMADRLIAAERRLAEIEAAFARVSEDSDRIATLETRVQALEAQLAKSALVASIAGPGMEPRAPQNLSRPSAAQRKTSTIDAYADGLREEFRGRLGKLHETHKADAERANRADALAAEASRIFKVERPEAAKKLRDVANDATARLNAVERLTEELEFYEPAEVPLAAHLAGRLEQKERPPDPSPLVEEIARAVIGAAAEPGAERDSWIDRAATVGSWTLIAPISGTPLDPAAHEALDGSGEKVAQLVAAGLRRGNGSVVIRARVRCREVGAATPAPGPARPAGPYGDVAGDGAIGAAEAAAAAGSSGDGPKIVNEDPVKFDAALAAEVAAAENELTAEQVSREQIAEVEAADEKP